MPIMPDPWQHLQELHLITRKIIKKKIKMYKLWKPQFNLVIWGKSLFTHVNSAASVCAFHSLDEKYLDSLLAKENPFAWLIIWVSDGVGRIFRF